MLIIIIIIIECILIHIQIVFLEFSYATLLEFLYEKSLGTDIGTLEKLKNLLLHLLITRHSELNDLLSPKVSGSDIVKILREDIAIIKRVLRAAAVNNVADGDSSSCKMNMKKILMSSKCF